MASTSSGMNSLFAGNTLGSILVGIIIFQTSSYWMHNRDGWQLRTMVSVMALSAMVIMVSVAYSLFNVLVVHSGRSDSLPLLMHAATTILTIFLTGMVIFLSHLFFIRTLYLVHRSRWWVWGSVLILALLCFALRLVAVVLATKGSFVTGDGHWIWLAITVNCVAALADLIVTVNVASFLHVPTAASQKALFRRLCTYSILRGSCVVLVQVAEAILFAIPGNRIWMSLDTNVAHIYCVTTFAMLNSRVYLRGMRSGPIVDSAVHVTHTSPSLRFADQPNSFTTENQDANPEEQDLQVDLSNLHSLIQNNSDSSTARPSSDTSAGQSPRIATPTTIFRRSLQSPSLAAV